jgi:hypothetical protein
MKVLPATSLIDTNFFVGKLNFAKIFDWILNSLKLLRG